MACHPLSTRRRRRRRNRRTRAPYREILCSLSGKVRSPAKRGGWDVETSIGENARDSWDREVVYFVVWALVSADNRKKERKGRIRAGRQMSSYSESAAVLSGESIESIQREKKRAREGDGERERERERIAPRRHNWPRQDASARARRMHLDSYPCAPVGSSCRSGSGESGSGLGSKMLHERVHVRRCNWPLARSLACRPVQPARAYVRIRDRAIPPTLPRERASTLTCFLPYRFICNLKRGLDCPMPAPPPPPPPTPAYQPRVHKFVRIFPVLNVCGLLEKYPRLNSPLPAYLIVDSFHRLVKRGISGGARGEGGGGGGMGEREKDRFRFFIPSPPPPSFAQQRNLGRNRRSTTRFLAFSFEILSSPVTTGCRERKSGSRSRYTAPFLFPYTPALVHSVHADKRCGGGRKMLGHLSDSVDR